MAARELSGEGGVEYKKWTAPPKAFNTWKRFP